MNQLHRNRRSPIELCLGRVWEAPVIMKIPRWIMSVRRSRNAWSAFIISLSIGSSRIIASGIGRYNA
jgi:hypothetical protein